MLIPLPQVGFGMCNSSEKNVKNSPNFFLWWEKIGMYVFHCVLKGLHEYRRSSIVGTLLILDSPLQSVGRFKFRLTFHMETAAPGDLRA